VTYIVLPRICRRRSRRPGSNEGRDRPPRAISTPTGTRRWLLERAAVGAAGVAAAGSVVPIGDAYADSSSYDSINAWGVFASTTEALTVTILTELVRRASVNSVPSYPSTKRFWARGRDPLLANHICSPGSQPSFARLGATCQS